MKLTIEIDNADEIRAVLAALSGGAPAAAPAASPAPKPAKAEKKEPPAPAAPVPDPAPPPPPTPETPAVWAEAPVPTEAEIVAAANTCIEALGPGSQARIKAFIAGKYQRDDGSPAALKFIREDQKAALLDDLKAMAAGTLAV